jgi:integrase
MQQSPDHIEPFTEKQIEAILVSCKRSRHPQAMMPLSTLLLDTGVHCSEPCQAKVTHFCI